MTTITVEHEGTNYKAEWRQRTYGRGGGNAYHAKARAHIWGPGDDRNPSVEFQALADHIGAPSVYTKKGEWPPLDKAFNKMNREIVEAKRKLLDKALKALDISIEKKPSFSRKAGCSCGCSPGFILDTYRHDLYVSEIKEEDNK